MTALEFVLTGCAGEIDRDPKIQLGVLKPLGIKSLDLQTIWGTNVVALDEDELTPVKNEFTERDMAVSAIRSLIKNVDVTDPFASGPL